MNDIALDPAAARVLGSADAAEAAVHPPRLRDALVGRAALVNRLRAERAAVIAVSAPAGYGKTTLLAQWAQRDARKFAWIGLSAEDNSPAAFLRLVIDAIGRVVELDESLKAPFNRRLSSVQRSARQLARYLFDNRTPLVLVLDGIERLEAPEALDVVELICDHGSPPTQIVLAGRAAPPALLARLRAEGRLAELGRSDLELTDREVAAILRSEGVDAGTSDAAELNRRAEGWVTGVYLSAVALRTSYGRRPRSTSSVGGAHHFIAEYFETQVLDRLPPEDSNFVTELALLDRVAGPVCDAVLSTEGSGAKLRQLADHGTFLVPLDREHNWYRLHGFLRDALRRALEQDEPARFAELSRRAAAWYVKTGDRPRAIEYLVAIGDLPGATRELGETVPAIASRGVDPKIEAALAELDNDELLLGDQAAVVAGALGHALLGHVKDTTRWAGLVDRAAPTTPRCEGTKSSLAWAAVLAAALCRSGVEQMAEDAGTAIDRIERRSPVFAFASFLRGVSQLIGGDHDAAALTFTDASTLAESIDAPLVASMACAELSLVAHEGDEWSLGETLARRACDFAEGVVPSGHAATCLAYVASVRSALRNSNWVRANDHMARIHALLPSCTGTMPWLAVQVRLELAQAHLALNDAAAAHELLLESEQLLVAHPRLGTLHEGAASLRNELTAVSHQTSGARGSLTAAELRLLPLLTTHMTFRQIAEQLYVSRNTVKTQAISVYRKLGASSRTEAIDRAVEVGLLRPEGDIVERLG